VAITDTQIRRIARLARLDISEAEIAAQHRHINALMDRFEALREVDVAGVAPTSHSIPLVSVLRDDRAVDSLTREAVLSNAPDARDGCFAAPRILEE
jgi:aspartyl-tRNA(Asn)/glutamyl-tRNA(Gln) amidotransferase subunit C